MSFHVVNRRTSPKTIATRWPQAVVIDVTSRAPQPWVQLSPFYPHGDIPVPMTPGVTGESVEGIWQALKVFERADVDPTKLAVTSMKNLKRSERRFGAVRAIGPVSAARSCCSMRTHGGRSTFRPTGGCWRTGPPSSSASFVSGRP